MNQAASERAEQLAHQPMTLSEYRNQLVRLKNMALLCHCSAEIDQGTLLFFSVNNMFLGQGDCFVLLFSESSAPAPRKEHGEDLYGRVYLYALINEVLAEVLGGHFSYYSAELDGRLVSIIHFPLGLLPSHAHDLPLLIQDSCAEIAQLCRERYDLRVTAYLSDRVSDIASISVVYHKLLNLVTLHRYLQLIPDTPVVLVTPPPPDEHIEPFPIRQLAQNLANAVLEGEGYHEAADQALTQITQFALFSADELRTRFGDFFEAFCAELRFRGVPLQDERLRMENFSLINESHTWQDHVAWFHSVLDRIDTSHNTQSSEFRHACLERLLDCVEHHIGDVNLNTAMLAESTGFPLHLVKLVFRQQMQTSPTRYIRSRRLEEAARLLTESDRSVSEICTQCGFGSLETFHRVFRQEYGITPGKFRKLQAGVPAAPESDAP